MRSEISKLIVRLNRRILEAGIALMDRLEGRELQTAGFPVGPLVALIDALERRRAVFWSGYTLVELDDDYVPDGPITMVLDAVDFAALTSLKCLLEGRVDENEEIGRTVREQITTLDRLGGLIGDEAAVLAEWNLNNAREFERNAQADPEGKWLGLAEWVKGRARLFHQLAAEESEAQDKYERQRDAQETIGE